MNNYITVEIKNKWPNYEFKGKSFKLKDGKTYIRAYSKTFETIHYYCIDDDWFWHDKPITINNENIS